MTLEFHFHQPSGCLTKPFRNVSLCFGVRGRTPGLIFRSNYVKTRFECIGHPNYFSARCDSMFTQLSSGLKQNVHTKFCFQNPLSESKELQYSGCSKILQSFVMQLEGHFRQNQQQQNCLCQFELILDSHISRHLLPAPFRFEIKNTSKRFIGSQPHSHKPFVPILILLSQRDRHGNEILWQVCTFLPSMMYKETWLNKTSYNSHTVDDKQTKLGLCTDVGW
jgi:hypothetical protein